MDFFRVAYIVRLLSCAIITPDWNLVTLGVLSVPMILFYGLALLFDMLNIRGFEKMTKSSNKNTYSVYNLKGKILSINDLMSPEDMGITLPHKNLISKRRDLDINKDDKELLIKNVKLFHAEGGRTIIDMGNERIKRNPKVLREIAEETGVNIIMGTGQYKDTGEPFKEESKPVEVIAQQIYQDIIEGLEVDGERIHSGHIGEIVISRNLTEIEKKFLRASARVQKITGAALSIHFDLDAPDNVYEYVVKILEEEMIDTRRLVINNIISRLDNVDKIVYLAKKGFNITLGHFGLDVDPGMKKLINTTSEEQIITIKELLRLGLIDHLMLLQGVCFKVPISVNSGCGYTRILSEIVPYLRRIHVNEYDIDRMITHNARRVFSFGGRFPSY